MLAENGFNFRAGEDLKNNEGIHLFHPGNTPLHLACEKPNLEIMLFLLMQGSDYAVKNNKGYKPGENTLDARMYMSLT
jgi:ankyrin repeat protein